MGYPTQKPARVNGQTYDYIVVGGGTAGCVVAARLSEDPAVRVLVLERGAVVDTWASHVPLLSSNFTGADAPAYKWQSTPQAALGGRALAMASGKALGGTSLINALLYTRSIPAEYNEWEQAGRKGWGWRDVEPFFNKSEDYLANPRPSYRGGKGPWKNQVIPENSFPITEQSARAAADLGIPGVPDANDPNAPAVSCVRLGSTIDSHGRRNSAFDAFLPAKIACSRKRNLHICTGTVVCAIHMQTMAGETRATGVRFQEENGGKAPVTYSASAAREIILCAGAIATPQLLMLSGIGLEEHLRFHDSVVVKHLPGVGDHLQDHLSVPLMYKVPITSSIEGLIAKPLLAVGQLLKYIFTGKGLFGAQVQQADTFLLSRLLDEDGRTVTDNSERDMNPEDPANIPDVEVMFLPVNPDPPASYKPTFGTFSYLCAALRPRSAGTVRLASLNPRDRPLCDLGTLSAPEDFAVLRKALRVGFALARNVRASGGTLEDQSVPKSEADADLDEFIREKVITTYHYSGTCRMAPEREGGVVDDELRVHGVARLRIADASIFPGIIPACHLQAPVVMVAERCANFVKAAHASEQT